MTIRIYKPTFESFISEAKGTVYIQGLANSGTYFVTHSIVVSAINAHNHVLHYTFSFSKHVTRDQENFLRACQKAKKYEEELKSAIGFKGFFVREGIMFPEQPVDGEIFAAKKQEEEKA